MSQLVCCIYWSPVEVGSIASEGMDELTRQGQAGKEEINNPILPPLPLYKFPAEGMTQIKGVSSHSKTWIKAVFHPASNSRPKACVFQPQDLNQGQVVFLI